MPLLNDGRPILLFVLLVLILFLAGVPIQAPPIRIARRIRIRRRLDWRSRADLHYPDAVVAHIPKGQARRQARSLGPRKVSDEALGVNWEPTLFGVRAGVQLYTRSSF